MRQLVAALQPDLVVVVADAALGTINLIRLSVEALGCPPPIVYCNRYDGRNDLHRRNRQWLRANDGLEVVTAIDRLASRVASQ